MRSIWTAEPTTDWSLSIKRLNSLYGRTDSLQESDKCVLFLFMLM